MGIDRHGRFLEYHRCNDIRRLATNARQFDKLIDLGWYRTAKITEEHARHAHQMFRFVVGIADAADVTENGFGAGSRQCFRCRIIAKEGWCGEVDPFVGALRTEDDGYQKLKGVVVNEFRFRQTDMGFEPGKHFVITFLFGHQRGGMLFASKFVIFTLKAPIFFNAGTPLSAYS